MIFVAHWVIERQWCTLFATITNIPYLPSFILLVKWTQISYVLSGITSLFNQQCIARSNHLNFTSILTVCHNIAKLSRLPSSIQECVGCLPNDPGLYLVPLSNPGLHGLVFLPLRRVTYLPAYPYLWHSPCFRWANIGIHHLFVVIW